MKKALLTKLSVWAAEYSYTFTAKVWSAAGAQTLNDVSWTMAGTGGEYFGYDGTKGQQFGSGSKPYSAVSLSTSGISGTITSVVVNTSGANSIAGTVAVSVGGTAFTSGEGGESATLTNTATDYTFTGSASGQIVISWAQTSSKAIYVKSITVTYSGGKPDPELSFPKTTYNATYGEEFTPPTLQTATGFNGTVEYESSDPSVARVSDPETGELRIVKGGETTITATFEGNDDFKAGSASYKLIVTDNRIATTTTQDDIVLDLTDVATLTRLAPIVKDASSNVIAYQYDSWPTEMSFEVVSDDNSIIGSLDWNTGEITLNAVAGKAKLKALYNHYGVNTTYQPSECTFTITVVSPLDNIAALTANTEEGTYKVQLTDAVVTFVSGKYAYIQDASGAVAMFKDGHGLTAGDVLNGTATVTYQLNKNNPQITDLSGVTPVAGDAPNPVELEQDDWAYTFEEVLSQYFKVTNATITQNGTKYYVSLNGDLVQLYKAGGSLTGLDLSKKYTITGFPTLYNTTKELQIFADPEEGASIVATLPFKFDGGIADIATTPGLTQTGLGSDYSSSPKLKFDSTDDELILSIDEIPGALTFDIKGNGFKDGSTFTVQTSADGTNYEDLATYKELGAKKTELFNLLSNVRYIKWKFTEKVSGNVALGNINLIKKYAVKIGDAGYATFWSMRAHDFTGLTAYVVSEINEGKLTLTEVESAPSSTGVILKAEAGIYELEETNSPATVGTNLLRTSRGANYAGEAPAYDYYALANKDACLGFYKLKDGEYIPNGKCFLSVAKTASAPDFLSFGGDDNTTSVNDVRSKMEEGRGEFYNLNGQRVAQPTKGLYIVNGKKYIVK